MEEFLLLQAGNFQLGLNLPLIREIQGVSAPSEEQAAEGHQRMQVVDGKEIPLYDLSSILEKKMTSYESDSKKAVRIESAGRSLLLAVDRIDRVVSVDSVQIKPIPPIFKGLSVSCFPHVLKHKDKLILVLNPKGIEQAEQEMLTRNHLISKPDATKALHEDEEIIDLVDEVPSVLMNDRILQDKDRNSDLLIQKTASSMPYPVFTHSVERKEMSDSESNPSAIIGNEADSEDESALSYVEEKPAIKNTAAEMEPHVSEEVMPSHKSDTTVKQSKRLAAGFEKITQGPETARFSEMQKESVVKDIESEDTITPKDSFLDTLSIGEDPENELPFATPLGEADSPFPPIDHKQAIDPAQMERIVTKMLSEEKLAARVESVVIKMLKKFKVTDKINRIFFQALETPVSLAVKGVKEAMRRPKVFLKSENQLQETPAVDSPVADSEQQINVIDKLGRNTGSRLKKIIQEKEMNPSDPDNRQHGIKMSVKAERPV